MRRLGWFLIPLLLVGLAIAWRMSAPAPPPTDAPVAAREVVVFLAQETPDFEHVLVAAQRQVAASASAPAASLRALAEGPTVEEEERGLMATLPAGTRVLDMDMEGSVATANFSRELQENFNGGAAWEEIVLYSIVNTLTAVEGVTAVRVQVEGAPIESVGGHLEAHGLLRRNDALVARGSAQ